MKKLLCVALLFGAALVSAQSSKMVENSQLTINFLSPGITYEYGIANKSTLAAELSFGVFARGCTGCTTMWGVFPNLTAQYRNYLNFDRRLRKGKSIDGNRGNYIALSTGYQFKNALLGNTDLNDNYFSVGSVYGIQRTYRRGFNFGLEFGVAYITDGEGHGIYPTFNAKLGWVIGKNRK